MGWRFGVALVGTLAVPLLWVVAKKLFRSPVLATFGAGMLASAFSRSTRASTSTSGADAPAVMPILRRPASHAGSSSSAEPISRASQPIFCATSRRRLLFELVGERANVSSAKHAFLAVYGEGHALYTARRFAEAAEVLARAAALAPDDEMTAHLLADARDLAVHAPAADWQPILSLKTK